MTNLNSVNIGMNKYCGPAVLSILTGKSTDECARVISSINGKYTIVGVELKHLLIAADRMGFDNELIPHGSSLYGSLIRLVNSDGLYIVAVANHFVAIEVKERKIYFCDNHTKEPMPAASSARLLQQVKAVHKVFKRREPLLIRRKIVAQKEYIGGDIEITITEQITYDIERYNRAVVIAKFKLGERRDLEEIIEALKQGEYNVY